MSVYQPIKDYLSKASGGSVRLTFAQLEKIISRPLPRSAYRHREWWANNPTGHSHARSWTDAGWKTQEVDLEKRVLVFSKGKGGPSRGGPIADPFGAMRGSVTFVPGVDLTEPTGEKWAAERGGRG